MRKVEQIQTERNLIGEQSNCWGREKLIGKEMKCTKKN